MKGLNALLAYTPHRRSHEQRDTPSQRQRPSHRQRGQTRRKWRWVGSIHYPGYRTRRPWPGCFCRSGYGGLPQRGDVDATHLAPFPAYHFCRHSFGSVPPSSHKTPALIQPRCSPLRHKKKLRKIVKNPGRGSPDHDIFNRIEKFFPTGCPSGKPLFKVGGHNTLKGNLQNSGDL